ncbi:growth factor receptor-bound protein 14-like, partial [Thrips palmi]|uniref:Growth factor receptor-bound protein 14-like n=1 Tax=Thrips palmi TaxID=161013 RepID=A0A6P8Z5K3_THRPL
HRTAASQCCSVRPARRSRHSACARSWCSPFPRCSRLRRCFVYNPRIVCSVTPPPDGRQFSEFAAQPDRCAASEVCVAFPQAGLVEFSESCDVCCCCCYCFVGGATNSVVHPWREAAAFSSGVIPRSIVASSRYQDYRTGCVPGRSLHKLKCAYAEAGATLSHSLSHSLSQGFSQGLSLSPGLAALAGTLAGYEPLSEVAEEQDKDCSTEKQEELLFYNDDGSPHAAQSVLVERNLRSADLCSVLAVKNRVAKDVHWTLFEHWPEQGLERSLEDHEDVLSVHRDMQSFCKYSDRRFVFRKDYRKYEFFADPQQFFPPDMVVDLEGQEDSGGGSVYNYSVALQTALANADDSPTILTQVWVRDSHKQVWAKAFLLLRDRCLYISYKFQVLAKFLRENRRVDPSLLTYSTHKGDVDAHGGVQLLCSLRDYTVYSCLNARNQLRAPTEWGLCLRPTAQHAERDNDHSPAGTGIAATKCLACDSEHVRTCLLTAMRLAKYGRQLRENYRSFKNKQAESINTKDYNSYTVPIESVRSRVAMDFTGAVGRIVEDPKEAKAIAAAEGYSWKRRWRRNQVLGHAGVAEGTVRVALGLESGIHTTQPWFHSGMTREQAAQLVSRHGTVDGVFLVRDSRSTPSAFVLTFKCAGKVLHTQIQPVVDPVRDAICYSLDSGVTKFYDVLQLVEFYQLNAGCLPTRLTHYVVQSPAFHNNNNNNASSSVSGSNNNNNLSSSSNLSTTSSGGGSRSSSTPSSPCASFRGSGAPLLSPDTTGPPCASF